MNEVLKTIKERSSIRAYTDEKLTKEEINEAMKNSTSDTLGYTDEEIVSVSHLAPIHDIGKTVQTKYHQTKNTLFPSWAINA